jgi:hypothetical protein
MRMPSCEYIIQTKHPDSNQGNSEWHCKKFDWTDTRYKTEKQTGIFTGILTEWFNEDLFKQCFACPFNREEPLPAVEEEEIPDDEIIDDDDIPDDDIPDIPDDDDDEVIPGEDEDDIPEEEIIPEEEEEEEVIPEQ